MDSLSLITAQVSFLVSHPLLSGRKPIVAFKDPKLALIHIPIKYYSFFLQPILRLLFGEDHDEDAAKIPWTNRHDFLNISITPIEISIICTRELTERLIVSVENALRDLFAKDNPSWHVVEIVREDYTVIQVDGQGLDAGQRVLELTGPLAMAGISIFFITTYFSDYVLVPCRARRTVTLALEQRGFVFSAVADAFISQLSPTIQHMHNRYDSSSSGSSGWSPNNSRPPSASAPTTPPAKNVNELQIRTFKKLKDLDIRPQADETLRLVSCAGSRESDSSMDERLKNDVLQVLLATSPSTPGPSLMSGLHISNIAPESDANSMSNFAAKFLSITITSNEPVSILLEEHLLPRLGNSLLGAKDADDVLVPITFDLRDLGFGTTGIVGGVAGILAQPNRSKQLGFQNEYDVSPTSPAYVGHFEDSGATAGPVEISFLSTAKSGTVIVKATQLERAMRELERGYDEVDG